ncbi:hypothetical protein X943_000327 [Babesia divergens]|uniref:Uncharacterized protein n=1 Tax=Babesia divergens TaxID=32595 RepID=A0AAD9GCJ7_BABDI|nr:hypothetical protein X943_000327 [Babesia divergens]
MAYSMPIESSPIPIVHLFPAEESAATLNSNCPGGVCITEHLDKVFRFTPKKEGSRWHHLLTYSPLIILVLLLLGLIAWITIHYSRRSKEYEDALEQRLIDAMDEEEQEVKV